MNATMRVRRGALRGLLATVLIGGLAIGACLAALIPGTTSLFAANAFSTPAIANLRALDQRSTVYDASGNQIGQLGIQDREDVSLSAVPKVLVNAVVATEDKTFWKNDGIDLASVVRAAVANFTSGKIEQGGSTITQQLVKNRILSSKRDLNRKIKEITLALRLNHVYSKNQILEQYLNTVYFGEGAYGVKAAAERYFRTGAPPFVVNGSLSNLTLSQAALLAGLIDDPEGNDPFLNPDSAQSRRSYVLDQMVKEKYVTPEQAATANADPLPNPALKPTGDLRPRDAWTEQVQDSLINDPRYAAVLGPTPQARTDALLKGGLKIYATEDPTAQANAQNAVDATLRQTGKPAFTSSLVAMDPNTGAVTAMVPGNPDFAANQYNIATHYPGRQMGSTWKVVTLAAALSAGFSPNDSVDGTTPCSFGDLGQTENAEAGGGIMSIRAATQNSVNCAFARIELAVGIPKVIAMAEKMGYTQDPSNLLPILTLTLGTIDATPLEMATYMSTVASGGIHHTPYFVSKIVGPDGNTIFTQNAAGDRVLSEDVADCEISLLHGVVTGGTGTGAQPDDGRPVFGKTGTTDDEHNAAFYGGTYQQLVAFVWYGDPAGNEGNAGFGGNVPAHIWKLFMQSQLGDTPPEPLPPQGPVCSRPGQSISDQGQRTGEASGITGNTVTVPTTTAPPAPTDTVPPATAAPAPTVPPTSPPSPTTTPVAPPTTAPPAPDH